MPLPRVAPQTTADRYPLLVLGLTASVATVGATIFAISPLLSDIAASFGIAPAQAGRMIGVYGLAMAVMAPARTISRTRCALDMTKTAFPGRASPYPVERIITWEGGGTGRGS